MSRVSTSQQKKHQQALDLLDKEVLTQDEKLFVYENYHEGSQNLNGLLGAFFTPLQLANDFRIGICGNKVIDLCAGIGILSYTFLHHLYHTSEIDITCVEVNPVFVEVGKKLLPEATWICADITDPDFLATVGSFDFAYGNPPFGNIKTAKNDRLKYKGSDFEFKALEVAGYLAPTGQFIIPQNSTPFRYSGVYSYERNFDNPKYVAWQKATKSHLTSCSIGVDTAPYQSMWRGTNQIVEIVDLDTSGRLYNPFEEVQTELFAV